MLVLTYAIAILDRVGMGLLVQPIEATLHISDTQMGLLQGFGFAIFFALLGLPAGMLADRTDRHRLIAIGIVIWSTATLGCGLATGFIGLFAARIFVGAGEATLSPAGTSMIGDYFPPRVRSRAFGVFSLGASIGTGTAFLAISGALILADRIVQTSAFFAGTPTWKIVFGLFSLPGFVMAVIFLTTVKEPPRREGGKAPPRLTLAPLIAQLRGNRLTYAALILGGLGSSVSTYALIGWFPTFLIRTYGWSASATAGMMGLYGAPCGIIGSLAAGWVVSEFHRRNRRDAPILVAALALACIAGGSLITSLSPTPTGSIIGYMIMGTAMNFPSVALLTGLHGVTPNALRGQVLSLLAITNSLVAQSLGPFAVGLLSDHVFGRTRGLGFSITTVVVIACTFAIVLLLSARRAYLAARAVIAAEA